MRLSLAQMRGAAPARCAPCPGDACSRGGRAGWAPGQVTLVVGGAALIRDRVAVFSSDPARLGEGFLGGRGTTQILLRLGRGEVRGADRGKAEPGLGYSLPA